MNLKTKNLHVPRIPPLPQKIIHIAAIRIKETICNSKVAKHLPILMLQPNLRISYNQKVIVPSHRSLARYHRKHLIKTQRNNQPSPIRHILLTYRRFTKTRQRHSLLCPHQHRNVLDLVNVFVKRGCVYRLQSVKFDCFFDDFLFVLLNGLPQNQFIIAIISQNSSIKKHLQTFLHHLLF